MTTSWEVVIGLEIHVQLATKSKIFSGSSTAYGADPNTQANLVDLGYPGVLPVLNKEVINLLPIICQKCSTDLRVPINLLPIIKS